jgi:hypothetical protein
MATAATAEAAAATLGVVQYYAWAVTATVTLWLVYLLLPRGVRRAYCRANQRRYRKRTTTTVRLGMDQGSSSESSCDGSRVRRLSRHGDEEESRQSQSPPRGQQQQHQLQQQYNVVDGNETTAPLASSAPSTTTPPHVNNNNRKPSYRHPSIPHLPDQAILDETMRRLSDRGVRLQAHGVHCDPKRVWIQIWSSTTTTSRLHPVVVIEWQSEVPRSIADQNGATSIVLMRGPKHSIPLHTVRYIDVGTRTLALTKAATSSHNNSSPTAATCFSLLTDAGSLDLQTNSRLERDAIVSCLCLRLDQTTMDQTQTEDWRALQQQEDTTTTTTTTNHKKKNPEELGAASSTVSSSWAVSNISSNGFGLSDV